MTPAPDPVAAVPDDTAERERLGPGIVRASAAGTAVFTATAVAAAIDPDAFRVPAVVTALGLFALGCGVFLWAYAIAIGRSRTDEIGIGGLFFLGGTTAPTPVRRRLLGLLAVQVLVAVVTAWVRPFTSLAFGTLVPIWGLALCGLWGARFGRFGPRVAPSRAARVEAVGRSGARVQAPPPDPAAAKPGAPPGATRAARTDRAGRSRSSRGSGGSRPSPGRSGPTAGGSGSR